MPGLLADEGLLVVALDVVPGDAVSGVELVEDGQAVLGAGPVVRLGSPVAAGPAPAVLLHRLTVAPEEVPAPACSAGPDVGHLCGRPAARAGRSIGGNPPAAQAGNNRTLDHRCMDWDREGVCAMFFGL